MKRLCWIGLTAALACLGASAPSDVTVKEDKPFPESLSSTADGTLYIGSVTKSAVFKAPKGSSTADVWIKPGTNGLQRVLGVFADPKAQTLWVCSNKNGANGAATALKAFDLKSGTAKGSFNFPGANSLCNDVAVAQDGTTYATDTIAGRIMRLKKGASSLDEWVKDAQLAGADGIAFGDRDTIYVNTFTTGHLLRIPVGKEGAAGMIAQLQPSQPLTSPDGMRAYGKNQFLMIEGAGKLDKVTIDGNNAKIETIKDGFNGPTAVTQTGNIAWVLEGKLKYMNDPKFKDQDPGTFKAFAVPIPKK